MGKKEELEDLKQKVEGAVYTLNSKIKELDDAAKNLVAAYDNKLAQKQTPFDLDKYFVNDLGNILRDAFRKFIVDGYNNPVRKIFDNAVEKHSDKVRDIMTNTIGLVLESEDFRLAFFEQAKKKFAESLVAEGQSILVRRCQNLKQSPEFNAKITLALNAAIDKIIKDTTDGNSPKVGF